MGRDVLAHEPETLSHEEEIIEMLDTISLRLHRMTLEMEETGKWLRYLAASVMGLAFGLGIGGLAYVAAFIYSWITG